MTYEEFKTEFGVMGIGWSEDEKGIVVGTLIPICVIHKGIECSFNLFGGFNALSEERRPKVLSLISGLVGTPLATREKQKWHNLRHRFIAIGNDEDDDAYLYIDSENDDTCGVSKLGEYGFNYDFDTETIESMNRAGWNIGDGGEWIMEEAK